MVAGLLVLSPISAEYLIGYGESTGRPLELLAGLLILAPLYGTVAVLIREITRRTGRGWPTNLMLSAAFGMIQAGLIDQTLFDNEVEPLGDVDGTVKYAVNAAMLGGVAGLLLMAAHRLRRQEPSAC
ncbi:hypothetical protein ABT063_47220 [Streptomyces sp. NPDC002838]|uniref:hypothetical protein n=1 Tax=Streptomyces sp. NPDC002838 TaxID=3154436 RepID=UPI00332B17C5